MTNIYDKHDKAFNNVNAYVIAHDLGKGIERIATIAFKRGASGNVRCFFHHIGFTMQSGNAGGGGYDKPSAAFYDAVEKHIKALGGRADVDDLEGIQARAIFEAAKAGNGSSQWCDALRKAGFAVLQAV